MEQNFFVIKRIDPTNEFKRTAKIYKLDVANDTNRMLAISEISFFKEFVKSVT
jgi:hypothetical protein